ncbi:MAG: tRNA pseudouridine(55) synthase TruB, partial [Longimicrobiales bacterium]
MKRSSSGPDGILPVDKPEGPTSHDIVARARRVLGQRRIGHTGTLDPFASGLLLLCLGASTRLAEYLVSLPKRYEAVARLGARTDTDDRTGEVLARSEAWRTLDLAVIERALRRQVGPLEQRPPSYSAKKVEGERLYARARRGESVVAEPVEVEIHGIDVLEIAPPDVRFSVVCSSGTYIRAIARDLGEALGVGGHLVDLRRAAIGGFDVAAAVSTDGLGDADAVARALIAPLDALAHLPRLDVSEDVAHGLAHGRAWREAGGPDAERVAIAHDGRLVAVGELLG